jgi:hypothetical protein
MQAIFNFALYVRLEYLFSLWSAQPELTVLEQEPEKAEPLLNLHDMIVSVVRIEFFLVLML